MALDGVHDNNKKSRKTFKTVRISIQKISASLATLQYDLFDEKFSQILVYKLLI